MSEEMDKQKLGEMQGIVFVGDKSVNAYYVPALTHIENKGFVIIKARGKCIPKAIGLAMKLCSFINNLNKTIEIGTFTTERDGKKINVAEIEIKLQK